MILGLPEITVFTVGGVILGIFLLLILWGLTFPKVVE